MKLTSETKLFFGIIAFTILLILVAVFAFSRPQKPIEKDVLITPTTYTRGNKDASVWLVEFSDFQCPACHAFSGLVDDLASTHEDKLYIAYRHYPLSQHTEAKDAARAAEAAGAQGKFFEMEKLLFDNQASLSATLYQELGKQLNLDMDVFETSLKDATLSKKIENDIKLGDQLGIQATPTFYLNGVKLELQTIDDLKKKVEEAIQQS